SPGCDHARRHDAWNGRLGGPVGAQGRSRSRRRSCHHADDRRRQEPGLRPRRLRLSHQADRPRPPGDGAEATPARPPGARRGRRRRAPAAPPAHARAGGLRGRRGGERAGCARAPARRLAERRPARPDDAGDGRLRVRRGAPPPRGLAGDSSRRHHGPRPVPRRPRTAQRVRAEDPPERRARPRSAPGRGARAGGDQRRPSETQGLMAKILLVEDNEMNRDMLSRRLGRRGYDVAIAVDGEQGVAMARSEAPALILMDMSLPGLDGWEATRQLKATPETRGIPVIALTAHAMSGDREKAIGAGCDDFDTKPVDLAPPLERIRSAGEALRRRASESGAGALIPDLDRICTATERLDALLGPGGGPVQESAQQAASAKPGTAQPAQHRAAILVVDDNEDNRDMLARRLRRQGYEVLTAAGGRAALDSLVERPLDLVLLDVMMPDLDG